MERVLNLFYELTSNVNIKKVEEDFEKYTLSFELTNVIKDLEWCVLKKISNYVNDRDRISLNIIVNDGEPYFFKLNDEQAYYIQTVSSINQIIDKDSSVFLEYKIIKNKVDTTTSIYDLDLFTSFLKEQKLLHLLNYLQKNLRTDTHNNYEVQNVESENIFFQSPIIKVSSSAIDNLAQQPLMEQELRSKILKSRSLNTNPQGFSKFNFIPDDFNDIRTINVNRHEIHLLFDKLKILFAASFLSNISDIKPDHSSVKLGFIGHNYLEVVSNLDNLDNSDSKNFFGIYEWVYQSSDIHDKLDLSRNIISRNFKVVGNKWILPDDTLSSIQSAHSIYLKENVEKYIETKNKVAEITTELSVKSKDVTEYFLSNFKNNNLTLLTYFISIFIFNSLSDNSDKKIFTEEKYYLSMVFLLISMIYLLITRNQLKKDVKINIRYFYSIKRIYRDIFDHRELNNLFHKRHLKYSIQNVKQTIDRFSWLWFFEVFFLSILTIYFTYFL
ncbi:hypothetical protein [Bacillus sp. ISL-37]|uniref:hypothetical protein n=1 Tax=Bacillus sp. ISL-37 TaxID=2819123 RepID=UPI001BE60975|nr:hypothetical protein [Bacillus sp. ISL-37]MBT2685310.1 hypothetical protein [Bacillus sp. ISL-37]